MLQDFTDETEEERQALLGWLGLWRDLMARRHLREVPPNPDMPDPWYSRDLDPEDFTAA
jgi:hypothetical protein